MGGPPCIHKNKKSCLTWVYTTHHALGMNFFFSLPFIFMTCASFISAAAQTLLKLRNTLMQTGDIPDMNLLLQVSSYGNIPCSSTQYTLENLLQDMIAYKWSRSFKILHENINDMVGSEGSSLFRLAYELENLEICDFLMHKDFAANIRFDGKYSIEDLKKLSDRYPRRIWRFVPNPRLLINSTAENALAMLAFIDQAKSESKIIAEDQVYDPSNLLGIVLQNLLFTDDEMAEIIQRLQQGGAKAANISRPGEDFAAEFKRLHPDHRKSYMLLFGAADN